MGNILYYVNPPPRLPWDDLLLAYYFDSLDGFIVVESTGSVDLVNAGVALSTGGTQGSTPKIIKRPDYLFPDPSFSKRRTFKTKVNLYFHDSAGGTCYVGTGSYTDSAFFGFIITDGVLNAICIDGSGTTEVEIDDWSEGEFEEEFEFEARFFPGARVEFWVDGILKASITTNIDFSQAHAARVVDICIDNGTNDEDKVLTLSAIILHQRP